VGVRRRRGRVAWRPAGGLYTLVVEAAGRRLALAQAAVWTLSYLELTRLLAATGGWATRRVSIVVGAVVVAAAPITLIDL